MRFLDVAHKDLMQVTRDWRAAAFLIAAPILFTVLMGIMMGGLNTGGAEDTRLPVGVLDRNGGLLGAEFAALLGQSGELRPVNLAENDAAGLEQKVRDGNLAAAVIIPAGYSAAILSDADARMEWIVDTKGENGSAAERGLQALTARLMGAVQSARLTADAYAAEKPFALPADREAFIAETVRRVITAWENPPVTMQITSGNTARQDAETAVPSGFAQASPGNMVTFALAGLIGAAEILVVERKSGTLDRLLTTSLSRREVLAGHFLAMCAMVFVQVILLGIFGQLVFGLEYLRAPLAFLVMAVAVTLWIGGMGLLIGVIARSSEQVAMFSVAPMLVLAGLGGAWMPLEVTGATFQTVGRLTPTAWAMQGMQNLILRGQGMEGALLPAGVLLLFAAAFVGLAVWRFQVE
jgi:ABC-2 type transport system permease protein